MNYLTALRIKLKAIRSSQSISTRMTKGMFAFGCSQVLNLLTKIILPPFYLHAWGIDIYGNWLSLTSIVVYLSITSLGGQLYLVNRLTQLHAEEDMKEFQTVFNSGLFLLIGLACIVMVIYTLLIGLSCPSCLLNINHISAEATRWILILLGLQLLSTLPQGLLTGSFQAIGKLPRGVMLNNLMSLGQLVFVAIALWLHAHPVSIVILQTIPVWLITCLALWQLKKYVGIPRFFSLHYVDFEKVRTFVKPSLNFLFIQVSLALTVEGLIILTGIILGTVQVVIFATMRTLINMMRQMLSLISNAAWPELTRLDNLQNYDLLLQLFRFILRSTMFIAFIIALVLHFFAEPLYGLWLHHKVPFEPGLMNIFILYGIELVFWTTSANLLMATNKHHGLSLVYLISAVISITSAYLGGHFFGLTGLVISMLIADLIGPCWLVPYLTYRYNPIFNSRFYLAELLPTTLAIVMVGLSKWLVIIVLPLYGIYWLFCLPKKINFLEKFNLGNQ